MATTSNKPLVSHLINGPDTQPVEAALYEYVTAGNGLFLRAKKPGLEVCFQLAAAEVRGLPDLENSFLWYYPPVEVEIIEEMLKLARQEALEDREILFYLRFDRNIGLGHWLLQIPEQEQSRAHCKPMDPMAGMDALIEVHSHHSMRAEFSSTDDRDEKGFRLYGVMGRVLTKPEIRLRVGCHGYFFDIDPSWVFELPDGLRGIV